MLFKKIVFGLSAFLFFSQCNASLIVPMSLVDAHGQGMPIGTIKLDDTVYGMLITPKLHDIPVGYHGFHVHAIPSCGAYGMAAGDHWDPLHTHSHRGPYRGSGHLGDLPVLVVNTHGRATLPILAPRLKISQLSGHSLVVMAGSDHYSDELSRQMADNIRIACGIVPYY